MRQTHAHHDLILRFIKMEIRLSKVKTFNLSVRTWHRRDRLSEVFQESLEREIETYKSARHLEYSATEAEMWKRRRFGQTSVILTRHILLCGKSPLSLIIRIIMKRCRMKLASFNKELTHLPPSARTRRGSKHHLQC